MTQHLPELLILVIVLILVIQETKETHIRFHCRRCGRTVKAKNIHEGCLCEDCYKEVKYEAACHRGLRDSQ